MKSFNSVMTRALGWTLILINFGGLAFSIHLAAPTRYGSSWNVPMLISSVVSFLLSLLVANHFLIQAKVGESLASVENLRLKTSGPGTYLFWQIITWIVFGVSLVGILVGVIRGLTASYVSDSAIGYAAALYSFILSWFAFCFAAYLGHIRFIAAASFSLKDARLVAEEA